MGERSFNTINTVASLDPNPGGGGQLPNPNKCNSTPTSTTSGDTLTPNPNVCDSTLTSGTSVWRNLPLMQNFCKML